MRTDPLARPRQRRCTTNPNSRSQAASAAARAPPPGAPPFVPGAKDGSVNTNAGSYSPYYLHLTRNDTEQEITSYSAILPPGLTGKLAGIPYCPDADIEAAKAQDRGRRARSPELPGGIGNRPHGRRLRPRRRPRLRPRPPLPRRALPRRRRFRSSPLTPPWSAPSTSA